MELRLDAEARDRPSAQPAFDLGNRRRVQDTLAKVVLGVEGVAPEDVFRKSLFKRGGGM